MPDIFADDGDAALRVDNKSSWADARGATVADAFGGAGSPPPKSNSAVRVAVNSGGDQYDNYRYFAALDTSGISVKPESATFNLYGFQQFSAQIIVVKVNAGATGGIGSDYTLEDYDQVTSTAYSAEVTSWSVSGYNKITLNDDALQDMVDLDVFKLAVIDHDFDFSNSIPADSLVRRTGFYFVDESGTSKDPVLQYVEGTPSTPTFNQSGPSGLISDDFTINSFSQGNLSVQYDREGSSQVPFILGGPGPLRIRGKIIAQVIKKGDKKN